MCADRQGGADSAGRVGGGGGRAAAVRAQPGGCPRLTRRALVREHLYWFFKLRSVFLFYSHQYTTNKDI